MVYAISITDAMKTSHNQKLARSLSKKRAYQYQDGVLHLPKIYAKILSNYNYYKHKKGSKRGKPGTANYRRIAKELGHNHNSIRNWLRNTSPHRVIKGTPRIIKHNTYRHIDDTRLEKFAGVDKRTALLLTLDDKIQDHLLNNPHLLEKDDTLHKYLDSLE